MIIIATVNNKGGVAKTTTTANVGACLSYLGYKVLLVDSDPQSNLTQHFNFYDGFERSIYNAYSDARKKPRESKLPIINIPKNNNLFLVPSSPKLRNTERELVNYAEPNRVLKKILKNYSDGFDVCIIDLPPSLGGLTTNAIFACDQVLIPIEAGQFSINGVTEIMQYLQELREEADLDFDLLGAFMSKFDVRTSISFAAQEEVSGYFKEKMFNTYVRINTDIAKAQTHGEDIYMFSRNSNSAKDYEELTKEILVRLELVTVNA